jgi:TonB-dependent starch-binding outer membrane protein SusC
MRKRINRLMGKTSFLLFVFSFVMLSAMAQTSQVKGVITDRNGNPLGGVTVAVKGTSRITTTADNGSFTVDAAAGEVLVLTSVGYEDAEIRIGNGQTAVSYSLAQRIDVMEDVVVVGYGTQRRGDLTGSIVGVNVNETKKYSTSDITQLLQGRATGVAINSDGQPGSVPTVRIRGFSTFGNPQPFYVVDGVPVGNSIRDFSPNDIESIQVLKDAAAAAIYGAEAANGVIIITTKQGARNTPMRVEYNGHYGFDKVWQIKDVTNRVEYQMLNNEARVNGNQPLFPGNDPNSPEFIDNIDTDWQKEGLKTGKRQNHNISLSGGGLNSTYNISLDYFDQQGTYVGNGPSYERYTARINSSAEKGIFKIGQSFSYTHSHENSLTFRDDILLGAIPPLINSLVRAIPTMPVYDAANEGGFGGSDSELHGENSLNGIGVNHLFKNYVDVDRIFGNIYGELKLLRRGGHSLRYKLSLSYDRTVTRDYAWAPEFFLGEFFSNTIARLNDNSRNFSNGAIENTITYDKAFGKHNLTVLAGHSYRNNKFLIRESYAQVFSKPYYPVIDAGQERSSKGSERVNTLNSYFGRINYSYDDRYLVGASIRRDGSSRFSPAYRYGNFPAASVGWKISNEKFWTVPKSLVSFLKFRASYGRLGNQNIGDYGFQAIINSGVVYTFNGVRYTGGLQTSVVSETLKWEGKATTNVGFDAALLDSRLDLSVEYYDAKSTDVLVGVPIPASVGSINLSPTVNAATLKNSGIEISATYHKTNGDFTFDVSANFSTVKNKVLALGGNDEPITGAGARTEVGQPVGQHYGYVYDGLFQTLAEAQAANQLAPNLGPGDVRYKDISGPDGRPDGVVNEAYDRVYLGSGIPKFHYGFNFSAQYKGFDFSLFASGSGKFLINSRFWKDLMHSGGAANYSRDMLDRWTENNKDTDIPRLNSADVNNFRDSNRPGWLQDGTYLRINTLMVGYTLPSNLIRGVNRLRVYITAQNLYTFQKFKGYNPDFTAGVFSPGFDFGSYPKPRTIMGGVQLIF